MFNIILVYILYIQTKNNNYIFEYNYYFYFIINFWIFKIKIFK
uniref:Uncharacterized protein n=1 Tax=viral metagenome TaxID=1070528 RepID=A0A6C0H7B2_9ZZZZ